MKLKNLMVMVLLALCVGGLYFNILPNQATNWDDPALFNRTSLHAINAENLKDVLALRSLSTYQPVRDLSYMLDFHFWGARAVLGMHLHNMALYFLMVVSLWFFLRELFGAFEVEERQAWLWALFTTLIFTFHPVHVESVTWLYARKEPLLGIFTFLSLYAFLKARAGAWWLYGLSALSFVLAVLAKPTALMLPLVMLLIGLCLRLKKRESIKLSALYFFVPVAAVASLMIYWLVTMMWAAGGIKPWHGGNPWTNLLAASRIAVGYVQLVCCTRGYAADYVVKLYADPFLWQAWGFVAVNILLVGSAFYALAERRYLATVFVGWFYIFLLPVVHILPINQLLADRYALLPSLSWCALLGWGLAWLWTYAGARFSAGFLKLIAGIVLFFLLLTYGLMTLTQNMVWLNSQTLWENTLKVAPTSGSANVNLSVIYIDQGRLKEAEALCITAIKRLPYDYLAISNLALAQLLQGQYDNALNNYTQALKLKPDLIKARLGRERAAWLKGDWALAYELETELIEKYGSGSAEQAPVVWHHHGVAAVRLGREAEGLKALKRADELAAANPQVWIDLGETYTSLGLKAEAAAVYKKTLPLLGKGPFKQGIEQRVRDLKAQ